MSCPKLENKHRAEMLFSCTGELSVSNGIGISDGVFCSGDSVLFLCYLLQDDCYICLVSYFLYGVSLCLFQSVRFS